MPLFGLGRSWFLAVFGRSSRFSVQMTPQAVTSWGSASGQSAKQAGVSFVGPVAELTQKYFLGQ